ncbi:MAG: hypothetical protein KJ970_07260 [Candidatus Eisenbacteria bacterium]|uniref:Cystatin domain-containing protein n=1 Tax=Eiseniibacteriota bacterium TaxID=2212470 RepID=A0A948RUC9_UNCEI|nr:hypothetical protein [Candidatus Eisenbacteria bacterium]MBU1948472.1 hypothetical protein [Candidatus Eisenbacteria bacterium]MBU2690711.1 hypothetical protein [Candidatus Eisenbacteria bacterium]
MAAKNSSALILFVAVLSLAAVGVSAQMFGAPIELQKPVYFPTVDGGMEFLEAGNYTLQRDGASLRIIPLGDDDGYVLSAEVMLHNQDIAGPVGLSIPGKGELFDIHMVVLLFPGGDALQAAGTYSGVMPRGIVSSAKNAARKARKAAEEAARKAEAAKRAAEEAAKKATEAAAREAAEAAKKAAAETARLAEAAAKEAEDAARAAEKATQKVVEDAAEALKLDKIDTFNRMQSLAQQTFEEADRLRRQAELAANNPELMAELMQQAVKQAALAMNQAWEAAVEAVTWLAEEAERFLKEMACKALLYMVQGMDLTAELSGPAAKAINEVTGPISDSFAGAMDVVMEATGGDKLMADLQGRISEGLSEIAPQVVLVNAVAEQLQSNQQVIPELREFLLSGSLCERSGDEIRTQLEEILGPAFSMLRYMKAPNAPAAPQAPIHSIADVEPVAPEEIDVDEGEPVAPEEIDVDEGEPGNGIEEPYKAPAHLAALDQRWAPETRRSQKIHGGLACAQTFTVDRTGKLSDLRIRVNRAPDNATPLAVEIVRVDSQDEPIRDPAAALFSGTLPPGEVPQIFNEQMTSIHLGGADIRVQSGDRLAVVITNPGPADYEWWYLDGYWEGRGYVSSSGQWRDRGGDFVFETEVTTSDLVMTRGDGAVNAEPAGIEQPTAAPVVRRLRADDWDDGSTIVSLRRLLAPQARGESQAADATWTPSSDEFQPVRCGLTFAQTFTLSQPGQLNTIALRINRRAWTGGNLILGLCPLDQNDRPVSDPAFALFTLEMSPDDFPLSYSEELTEIDVSWAGIAVLPGDQLAVTVTNQNPSAYLWFSRDGYANGQGFVGTPGGWDDIGGDFVFEAMVGPWSGGIMTRGADATDHTPPTDASGIQSRGGGSPTLCDYVWAGIQVGGSFKHVAAQLGVGCQMPEFGAWMFGGVGVTREGETTLQPIALQLGCFKKSQRDFGISLWRLSVVPVLSIEFEARDFLPESDRKIEIIPTQYDIVDVGEEGAIELRKQEMIKSGEWAELEKDLDDRVKKQRRSTKKISVDIVFDPQEIKRFVQGDVAFDHTIVGLMLTAGPEMEWTKLPTSGTGVSLTLSGAASFPLIQAPRPAPGAYIDCSPDNPSALQAAGFAAEEIAKEHTFLFRPPGPALKQLLQVQTQVVAGTNYKMKLELVDTSMWEAVVHKNPKGKLTMTQMNQIE